MSIYSYLKKDHQLVKDLMAKIDALNDDDTAERMKIFHKLKDEIIIHSKAEEKVFYKPLEKEPETKDEIPHAEDEHAEVEMMLEELSNEGLSASAWNKKFQKMCKALLHHIDEEEGEIFTDAKKELSAQEAMAMEEAMRKEKQKVKQQLKDE